MKQCRYKVYDAGVVIGEQAEDKREKRERQRFIVTLVLRGLLFFFLGCLLSFFLRTAFELKAFLAAQAGEGDEAGSGAIVAEETFPVHVGEDGIKIVDVAPEGEMEISEGLTLGN